MIWDPDDDQLDPLTFTPSRTRPVRPWRWGRVGRERWERGAFWLASPGDDIRCDPTQRGMRAQSQDVLNRASEHANFATDAVTLAIVEEKPECVIVNEATLWRRLWLGYKISGS